jgi:hypothetical protein
MAFSTIDKLYNGTSEKLNTTSTGIAVTGTVAATAYTGDGSALTGVGSPSIDDNGNATAMTITNDEKIGIGTTNPIGLLSIVDSSTGSGMELQPEIASNTNRFTNYNRTTSAYKNFRLDALQLEFQTSGNERLRIDNDGLKFNGDTAADNALNDYEEGTFSPIVSGGSNAGTVTYNTRIGQYTKVGNLVTVWMNINWSSGNGSGSLMVKGLPFSVINTARPVFNVISENVSLASNQLAAGFSNFSDGIIMVRNITGTGATLTLTYDSAGTLFLTGTYPTSA